jgi:VanZ family protein
MRTAKSSCQRSKINDSMMTRMVQMVAWLLLLVIIVLSLVPPTFRPVTVLPNSIEHLTMFSVTGLAFGIAYACRYPHTIALVLFAAVIELSQLFSSGRHARFSDFFVDAFGLCIGIIVGTLTRAGRLRSRERH